MELPEIGPEDKARLARYYLFRPCETRGELQQWLIGYLGLDFPDCVVDEDSNSSPMDMVWETYSKMRANNDENFSRVLYYACRDGYKTLAAAAIEVLAIVHLGRSVAHMAAIQEQASKAQSYVKKAFRRPHLKDFVVGDNERETKIVRFYNPRTKHSLTTAEYRALSAREKIEHVEIAQVLTEYREREEYIKIVICTMQGANSEHVPLLVIDEVDVVSNPSAYAEAQNIPSARAGKKALTILTSTRKSAFGIVQDEINAADKKLAEEGETTLHIRHWNLMDITEPCPASRHSCGVEHEPGHCPAERAVTIYRNDDTLRVVGENTFQQLTPKEKESYTKDAGYQGCLTKCRIFASCKTRLATHQHSKSTFLNKISDVTAKFRNQRTIEHALAQLLCRKPSSTGLIYPRFSKPRHVLTPALAYLKLYGEWPAAFPDGRDGRRMTKAEFMEHVRQREVRFYGGMDFGIGHNFAYVHGFQDGRRFFVTHVLSAAGLETDQQVAQTEHWREADAPSVFPDMADQQSIRIFRKNGWTMRAWKKGPKTVAAGITAVRAKLNPVGADEPELFFVHDVDEDEMMALLIQRVVEYHYILDAAGKPTEQPQSDMDDEVDALRYLIMNVFPEKGVGIQVGGAGADLGLPDPDRVPMAQPSAGHGYDVNTWVQQKVAELTGGAPPSPGRRMTIEAPEGSGYSSYYTEEDGTAKVKKPGKRREADEATAPGQGRTGRLIWDLG